MYTERSACGGTIKVAIFCRFLNRFSSNQKTLSRICTVNSWAPADRYCHCAVATGDAFDQCSLYWSPLAVGSTDPMALMKGTPEADSADCGGLAPKEVCGLLAVGHQYLDALGGTLEGR